MQSSGELSLLNMTDIFTLENNMLFLTWKQHVILKSEKITIAMVT